jgi:excinuclease ABC subunit A
VNQPPKRPISGQSSSFEPAFALIVAGHGLKRESLFFRIDGKNIAELAEMDISKLLQWLTGLEERMFIHTRQIARDVLKEIRSGFSF